LIKTLKQRGLNLQQAFEQIDTDGNNFIETVEFHDLLERLGFSISLNEVTELMKTMDENFDGKISYTELKEHIQKLGFDVEDINKY
jgi:Ca2+-binding EF-hand superfamily protein